MLTTDMGAGQAKFVAQEIRQRHARFKLAEDCLAVDCGPNQLMALRFAWVRSLLPGSDKFAASRFECFMRNPTQQGLPTVRDARRPSSWVQRRASAQLTSRVWPSAARVPCPRQRSR
ncbi:MAG: hypothetical protein ACI8W7_003462 [Gammaproteobacteria bacterium]|jgi:hypothetical protein